MKAPEKIRRAAELIREAAVIVTTGHVAPDGDALGSALALAHSARASGSEAVTVFGGDYGVPDGYRFLDLAPIVTPDALPSPSECVLVVFDTGIADRLGELARWSAGAAAVIVVDHHPPEGDFGDVRVIDDEAAAAAQLCHALIRELGWPITPPVATCLLTGIVTDTGRFQYSSTDAEVMRIAAELLEHGARPEEIGQHVYESAPFGYLAVSAAVLGRARLDTDLRLISSMVTTADLEAGGIGHEDLDPLIDDLRIVREADVAVLLKEIEGGHKVSLRSRGRIDVGAIARHEGGGGHHNAAGFTTSDAPEDVVERIRARLRD